MRKLYLIFSLALMHQTQAQITHQYSFDDGNATNEAGTDNNGTITGCTSDTDRFGNSGKAMRFNGGTTDFIDFGDITTFNSAAEFSISLWLNQDQLDVVNAIFHKSKNTGGNYNNYFQARTYDDGNIWFSDLRSPPNLISNASYDYSLSTAAGTWFHYVLVFNGAGLTDDERIKIYINNTLVTNGYSSSQPYQSTSFDLSGASFILGQGDPSYYAGNGWDGMMDDLYIFSNAINATQVDSLYNLPDPMAQNMLQEAGQTSFSFSPNPVNDELQFINPDKQECSIDIFSMTGQLIQSLHTDQSIGVSFHGLSPGIYTVHLKNEHTQQIKQIIKL